MKRPAWAKIEIEWQDEDGEYKSAFYTEKDLESAETLLSLMTGNICEEDLKP